MAVIAIDFDGTITADPVSFKNFAEKMIKEGHEIVIWSNRAARTGSMREGEMRRMREGLTLWQIPYTYIDQRGKLLADIYLDDKAVRYDPNNANVFHEVEDLVK